MIRHLKVARDAAVKAWSLAMLALKAIIVSAPSALREGLNRPTGKMALLRHLARYPASRPSHLDHGLCQGQPVSDRPTVAAPQHRSQTP